jgi:dTDP-4-dehydrorhamnose 3,5-epimerase
MDSMEKQISAPRGVNGDALSAPKETQAKQTVTADWDAISPPPIDGLFVKDVKNVIYRNGTLTELFRSEWFEDFPVRHITHVSLIPGKTTQWHRHRNQRDIVFPVRGYVRMGFYDGREESPTYGKSFVMNFNVARPRYVYIPPGVWHSLRNISQDEAVYIVLNDVEFDYADPDDWLLPPGSVTIPVTLD